MINWGRWARRLLVVAVIGGHSAAALADVLVIRSVGPSARRYPAGSRLPDNATLALRNGDSVAILKRNGTRVFRGPGTFNVAAAPARPQLAGTLARTGAGATRGGPGARVAFTDLWQYDAGSAGRACFLAGSPLTLWRYRFDEPLTLTLSTPDGASTSLIWPAGQQILTLKPAQLKAQTRISYHRSATTHPTEITLTELQAPAGDREALAAGLVEKGCRDQIETFAAIHEEKAE